MVVLDLILYDVINRLFSNSAAKIASFLAIFVTLQFFIVNLAKQVVKNSSFTCQLFEKR